MSPWSIVYFIVVLVLGVLLFMATDKVRKGIYRPYYMKPLMWFFGLWTLFFFLSSFWYLVQMS